MPFEFMFYTIQIFIIFSIILKNLKMLKSDKMVTYEALYWYEKFSCKFFPK